MTTIYNECCKKNINSQEVILPKSVFTEGLLGLLLVFFNSAARRVRNRITCKDTLRKREKKEEEENGEKEDEQFTMTMD